MNLITILTLLVGILPTDAPLYTPVSRPITYTFQDPVWCNTKSGIYHNHDDMCSAAMRCTQSCATTERAYCERRGARPCRLCRW